MNLASLALLLLGLGKTHPLSTCERSFWEIIDISQFFKSIQFLHQISPWTTEVNPCGHEYSRSLEWKKENQAQTCPNPRPNNLPNVLCAPADLITIISGRSTYVSVSTAILMYYFECKSKLIWFHALSFFPAISSSCSLTQASEPSLAESGSALGFPHGDLEKGSTCMPEWPDGSNSLREAHSFLPLIMLLSSSARLQCD